MRRWIPGADSRAASSNPSVNTSPFRVPTRNLSGFRLLVLDQLFDNDAISYDGNRGDGDEWIKVGVPYPAEELPESNSVTWVSGRPFLFPQKEDGAFNNLVLSGQSVALDPVECTTLSLLCAGEGEDYVEDVQVLFTSGQELTVQVGFSDSENRYTNLGSLVAFQCSHSHISRADVWRPRTMWLQNVTIDEPSSLQLLKFSVNPFAHIFAVTLQCANHCG